MPDQYGFETPDEIRAKIQGRFQQANLQFAKTAGGGPGAQLGLALSQIFAPMAAKHLQTQDDRKAYAQQLQAQGVDEDRAKKMAKKDVGADYDEVRKAEKIQDMQSLANGVASKVGATQGPMRGRAMGLFVLSNQLKQAGMENEAAALQEQAQTLIMQDDERLLALESAKVKLQTDKAGLKKLDQDIKFTGKTDFQRLQIGREEIDAKLLRDDLTEEERLDLQRQSVELSDRVTKLSAAAIGRTEFDSLLYDDVFMRQQGIKLLDNEVLDDQLDYALGVFDDLNGWKGTVLGRWTAKGIMAAQKYAGYEPTGKEEDFVRQFQGASAISSLIAAGVRHSLTGAQMSEFEIQYLEPFLPSPSDGRMEAMGKMRVLKQYTALDTNTRLQMMRSKTVQGFFDGRGYNVPVSKVEYDMMMDQRNERVNARETSVNDAVGAAAAPDAPLSNDQFIGQVADNLLRQRQAEADAEAKAKADAEAKAKEEKAP